MSGVKLVPVGLRVRPDMAEWLKAEAERTGRTVANLTNWVLQQYRQQQEQRKESGDA